MSKKILILLIVLLTVFGIYYIDKNKEEKSISKTSTEETVKEEKITTKEANPNEIIATIDGVSVRSSNSANGEYLGSLMTNDKVLIQEVMSNGWYKIKYKDSYGYVSSTYMKSTTQQNELKTLNTAKIKNNLNLKSKADKSASTVEKISKDTIVEIVDVTNNGWYKVKYKDKYGYVENSFLKITNSKKASTKNKITNLNNFLFIGDSYTYLLSNTIKANNQNVYISAQSGSRPCYWLDKVSDMTDNNNIEGIILLIGVNGIVSNGSDNSKTNIADTTRLIKQLMVKYPDKKIFVQKVFPVAATYTSNGVLASDINKYINKYNGSISSLCKKYDNLKYIDTTKGFIDNEGYLKNTADGLHISSDYNSNFYKNILNAVKDAK